MSSLTTDFTGNLKSLYKSYGGGRAIVTSGYFWMSVLVAGLSWRRASDESWTGIALSALPTLAGFSIAAFAILLAILGENARKALRAPAEELGGRSPLLALASTICHAVVVQVSTISFAYVFASKPLPPVYGVSSGTVNLVLSGAGVFLVAYSILLIAASVLSIFRTLEITSN